MHEASLNNFGALGRRFEGDFSSIAVISGR
jgi:hypothetical protein